MWLTTFQTADETMTHSFDKVKVICYFRFGIIRIIYCDNPIDSFSFIENKMTICEYEKFLETAKQLNQI
jgi:hypothetical protein